MRDDYRARWDAIDLMIAALFIGGGLGGARVYNSIQPALYAIFPEPIVLAVGIPFLIAGALAPFCLAVIIVGIVARKHYPVSAIGVQTRVQKSGESEIDYCLNCDLESVDGVVRTYAKEIAVLGIDIFTLEKGQNTVCSACYNADSVEYALRATKPVSELGKEDAHDGGERPRADPTDKLHRLAQELHDGPKAGHEIDFQNRLITRLRAIEKGIAFGVIEPVEDQGHKMKTVYRLTEVGERALKEHEQSVEKCD